MHSHTFTYNPEALLGGIFSWLWLQINIPNYSHLISTLNINTTIAGIGHLLVSLLIPLGSYILINVYKELLKDESSWVFKTQRKFVFIFGFKWVKITFLKKNKND
jgi:hypothetical protein